MKTTFLKSRAWPYRLICATLLLCATAFGQGNGSIFGTVTDASGLAVPGANVTATLIERASARTVSTDANGGYVLSLLPIGTYKVAINAGGFREFRLDSVTLDANQNVKLDARLSVGSVTESIVVSGEAALVESRSSMLGALIEDRRLTELPTNGRNIVALTALLPGAAQVSAPQTFTGDRSGPTVSMSGSRANANLFLFDGQNFNAVFRNTGLNYPPPDALQQVKVLTSNFSAEYGRNSGSVFNVVTKSGTNQFHGALWEFVRNSGLNARNFFSPSNTQLAQNQFGAAAGGPIKKDKLFVFGSYEGLRIRQGVLAGSAFPLTAAERSGDFSGGKAITDPLTNAPFPGNRISDQRIDVVSRTILSKNLLPLPNGPNGTLIQVFPEPQNNDQGLVRVDYNLGSKHLLEARYNHNYATQIDFGGQVPSYLPLDHIARVQSVTAADTYTITSRVLNQFRVSYNRAGIAIAALNNLSLSDLGGNFPVIGGVRIPPAVGISGRVSLGTNSSVNAVIVNEDRQISDSVSWTRNRHTIRAGFEYLRLRYLNRTYWFSMGDFQFTGAVTGNSAADFLIGRPQTLTVGSPVLEQGGNGTNFYQYVQDDWRVNSRLTLNLGLRYELPLPWVHPNNFWATFHPGQQSKVFPGAPVGIVTYGDPGVPRGMVQTDKNNFAPRFGFAWDVFGNGRTSVRGGFGIFYEALPATIMQNTGQPFRYQFSFPAPYSFSDPMRGLPAIPLTTDLSNPKFIGTQQINFPYPGLRTPYVEQINFAVQREVARNTVIQAAYVGKMGRKLTMAISSNPALYASGATLKNLNDRRIYRGYGDNQMLTTSGTSSYHALQIDGTKRFSHRFSLQGAYTFSKAIDQTSSTSPETPAAPQPFRLDLERGVAAFSARHVGSFSWIVDLPSFAGRPAALRLIAGGWQWNGLFTARTGLPLNAVLGSDVALSGTPQQRPNVVGDWRQPSGRSRASQIAAWFNPAAFAAPAAGAFGNAGRNVIVGPGSATVNAALFKNFKLPFREGMRFQFRSEFFNLLNQVNLGNPNLQLSGGKMGRITSAGEPRILQFALKFLW